MTNIEILKETQAKIVANTDILDPPEKQVLDIDLLCAITELLIKYKRSLNYEENHSVY